MARLVQEFVQPGALPDELLDRGVDAAVVAAEHDNPLQIQVAKPVGEENGNTDMSVLSPGGYVSIIRTNY